MNGYDRLHSSHTVSELTSVFVSAGGRFTKQFLSCTSRISACIELLRGAIRADKQRTIINYRQWLYSVAEFQSCQASARLLAAQSDKITSYHPTIRLLHAAPKVNVQYSNRKSVQRFSLFFLCTSFYAEMDKIVPFVRQPLSASSLREHLHLMR